MEWLVYSYTGQESAICVDNLVSVSSKWSAGQQRCSQWIEEIDDNEVMTDNCY